MLLHLRLDTCVNLTCQKQKVRLSCALDLDKFTGGFKLCQKIRQKRWPVFGFGFSVLSLLLLSSSLFETPATPPFPLGTWPPTLSLHCIALNYVAFTLILRKHNMFETGCESDMSHAEVHEFGVSHPVLPGFWQVEWF